MVKDLPYRIRQIAAAVRFAEQRKIDPFIRCSQPARSEKPDINRQRSPERVFVAQFARSIPSIAPGITTSVSSKSTALSSVSSFTANSAFSNSITR